jgi:hypothetical protein
MPNIFYPGDACANSPCGLQNHHRLELDSSERNATEGTFLASLALSHPRLEGLVYALDTTRREF